MNTSRRPRIHADAVIRMLGDRAVKFGAVAKLSPSDRALRALLILAAQTIKQQQQDGKNQFRMMEAVCASDF